MINFVDGSGKILNKAFVDTIIPGAGAEKPAFAGLGLTNISAKISVGVEKSGHVNSRIWFAKKPT